MEIEGSPIRELLLTVLEIDVQYCSKLLQHPYLIDNKNEVERNLAILRSIKKVTLAKVNSDWETLLNAIRC